MSETFATRISASLPRNSAGAVKWPGMVTVATTTMLSLVIGLAAASQNRLVLPGLLALGIALVSVVVIHVTSMRSTRLITFFSPASYILIVLVTLGLTRLQSPLKFAYGSTKSQNYAIFAIYLCLFGIGAAAVRVFDPPLGHSREPLSVNTTWLHGLFAVAVLAQLAKFIDIGHIPLLGDPTSRYNLGLGGFADYPSRLLAPLALLFFWRALDHTGLTKYRLAVALAFVLNLLFLQRQEVVNVGLGCVLIWGMKRRTSVKTILLTAVGLFVLAYGVIGVGAIIRLGTSSISATENPVTLPLWVIHREFTTPYALGQYVAERLGPGALHGTYSFGTYRAILGSNATTGAPLIQKEFTEATTAQTIGAPYSYYLDFGIAGVAAIGLSSGLLAGWFYRRMRRRRSDPILGVAYATLVLALLWSIRAGVPVMGSLVVYLLGGLLVVSEGGSGLLPEIRTIARPLFALSVVLSVVATAARAVGVG